MLCCLVLFCRFNPVTHGVPGIVMSMCQSVDFTLDQSFHIFPDYRSTYMDWDHIFAKQSWSQRLYPNDPSVPLTSPLAPP